jgi:hypothetical protein
MIIKPHNRILLVIILKYLCFSCIDEILYFNTNPDIDGKKVFEKTKYSKTTAFIIIPITGIDLTVNNVVNNI